MSTGGRGSYYGARNQPLLYLEIRPCCSCEISSESSPPSLTAAFVKLHLIKATLQSMMLEAAPEIRMRSSENSKPNGFMGGPLFVVGKESDAVAEDLILFRSDNPCRTDLWPCHCEGFAEKITHIKVQQAIVVTDTTMVRVLPVSCHICCPESYKDELTGELPVPNNDSLRQASIFEAQNPADVKDLTMRMNQLLSESTIVGTTRDALDQDRKERVRRRKSEYFVREMIHAQPTLSKLGAFSEKQQSSSSPFREGGILIHSPEHGSGKTALVEAIAQRLGARTYVIQPGALIAKFGVHADVALQSIVHAAALECSFRNHALCILLDDVDAIVPGTNRSMAGDAAAPALHATASYIHALTSSLQKSMELPFPSSNRMYNLNGRCGAVLPLRFCFVATLTCEDNGWRIAGNSFSSMSTYRLSSLTSATRLSAFRWACKQTEIDLDSELEEELPLLAASLVWVRGEAFYRIASELKSIVSSASSATKMVSKKHLSSVLRTFGDAMNNGYNVEFSSSTSGQTEKLFASVGGNEEAKAALEDALAMDPDRRKLLSSFGLSPPTGVLLYGPPGTGKTLLAKAVAKLVGPKGKRTSALGGAFISLSSSDIMRAEVGSGEKMVASAFQIARKNAPSVVFIDEFQALFTDRNRGGSSRLSTTLLQCMDDTKHWKDINEREKQDTDDEDEEGHVLVLAATNSPWMVDNAFLRPGRFDRSVHVGLPTLDERRSILELKIGQMKYEADVSKDELCTILADKTVGYSGADLTSLCKAAAVQCLLNRCESVTDHHFYEALNEGIVASSSQELVDRLKKWRP